MKSFYEGQRVAVKMDDQVVYLGRIAGFANNGNFVVLMDEAEYSNIEQDRIMAVGNVCTANSNKMPVKQMQYIMYQFRNQ